MTGTSLITRMAERRHLDTQQFYDTIKNTVMPKAATKDQLAAFLMVADRYQLDPLAKEIYAFPGKGGGITPVVSVDGWINLVNSHPQSNGFEFSYTQDSEGKLASVTCRMFRKDRDHPTVVTELLRENWRDTDPWRQMPSRMLRHKAFKEAARYCYGFAGITDEDEARDIVRGINAEHSQAVIVHDLDAFAEGRIGNPSTEDVQDMGDSPVSEALAGEEGGGGSSQRQQAAAADRLENLP
jgi:phage recombination protein Bet